MGINEKAWHVGFKWTIGDENNPTGAICLDDSSDALHICEIADARTDWNVSTTSHPTLYVHSATTPSTDYISMYHDGDYAYLGVDGTTLLTMTTTTLAIAVATTIAGDLDITTDDIAISQGYYMYFDGLGNATEYIRSDAADYMTMAATTGIDLVIGTTDEVAITASAVTLATNNLVLTAGNITVAVGSYLYLDGDTGNYLRTSTDDNVILNAGTTVSLGIGGTAEVKLAANVLSPQTSDGCALGSTSLMWSDLFLASGGVINFDNGDATIYHTASGQLVITASYAGLAIALSPSNAAGFISCSKYLRLYMTDVDGAVEGQVWYDNSEDQIKYNGTTIRTLVHSDSSGKVHLQGYLRLIRTDTDADAEGLVWYDNSEDAIKYYGTSVRTLVSSDTSGNVTIPANGHIYLDGGTSNYIYGNTDDQVFIVGARAGLAIYLDPSDATGYIQCGGYFKLMGTDTDGTLFAQMWFDNSEDKIKYHNGTAVRTIISSDSSGDIATVGHVTIPDDKYLYFGNTTNFIQGNSDNQLILTGSYAGLAIYLNPSDATGYIQCGGFLRLQVTADVGDVEGQIWYDSGSNKIHFWNGTAEQEVTSGGA